MSFFANPIENRADVVLIPFVDALFRFQNCVGLCDGHDRVVGPHDRVFHHQVAAAVAVAVARVAAAARFGGQQRRGLAGCDSIARQCAMCSIVVLHFRDRIARLIFL